MSLSIVATTVLVAYAILLIVIFRFTGFGIVATAVLGAVSTLAVWGSLHLIYFSDFLFTTPISNFLPQPSIEAFFASPQSIGSGQELSLIPLYFVALGWRFGIAFYVALWITAKLLMRWLRPNDSFKQKPLRGSAQSRG